MHEQSLIKIKNAAGNTIRINFWKSIYAPVGGPRNEEKKSAVA